MQLLNLILKVIFIIFNPSSYKKLSQIFLLKIQEWIPVFLLFLPLQDNPSIKKVLQVIHLFYVKSTYINLIVVSFRDIPMEQSMLPLLPALTAYFVFGHESKSSLVSQFCRQHHYQHLKNPIPQTLTTLTKNTMIEGSIELFKKIEAQIPELHAIFVGNQLSPEEEHIRQQYNKIGKAKTSSSLLYSSFRKSIYPKLIFFYGPVEEQIDAASATLAHNIKFTYAFIPQNANQIIKEFRKTTNFVFNGLFTSKEELTILQEYFEFKIIHFQYNRIDLPSKSQFFDKEYPLLQFLKNKNYYIKVNATKTPIEIMDQLGEKLCPELNYVLYSTPAHRQYLDQYVKNTDGLVLSILEIQSINKRKEIKLATNQFQKIQLLNHIIYSNFNRKEIFVLDFPFHPNEIVAFQNVNRKFSKFIDLTNTNTYEFSKTFNHQIYFLEQQKRFVPDINKPLIDQLQSSKNYWLITGPTCSGKSTLAKYISTQYGLKLLQFQPYLASIKQKLITPQDGEQLPLKKILNHFKNLINSQKQTYVIDGFPYDNKELTEWIKEIGAPTILNVKVQNDTLIKRTRKKAESDLNAEVGEEEKAKISQTFTKNNDWVNRLKQNSSKSIVHILDFNSPILLSQKSIAQIFKKRVYLVKKNTSLVFQNIAIRHGLAFINLDNNKLRECGSIVKNSLSSDVILCYYDKSQDQLISEDIHWIEKNLGEIRYLSVWTPQSQKIHDPKLQLEKPVQEVKARVEGEGGSEEKAPEEPPADDPNVKKQFDVYSFEWSQVESHRNLSQLFANSKKHVHHRKNTAQHCYQKFNEVLSQVKQGDNVYETIE